MFLWIFVQYQDRLARKEISNMQTTVASNFCKMFSYIYIFYTSANSVDMTTVWQVLHENWQLHVLITWSLWVVVSVCLCYVASSVLFIAISVVSSFGHTDIHLNLVQHTAAKAFFCISVSCFKITVWEDLPCLNKWLFGKSRANWIPQQF